MLSVQGRGDSNKGFGISDKWKSKKSAGQGVAGSDLIGLLRVDGKWMGAVTEE